MISLLINIKAFVMWVSLSPSQGSLETETTLRLLMETSLEVCLQVQGNGRGSWQFGKDIDLEIGTFLFDSFLHLVLLFFSKSWNNPTKNS